MWRLLPRCRLWLVGTIAQVLLSAMLCNTSLFDLLGYEFCFASGVLAACTGHLIGLEAARQRRPVLLALIRCALHLLPGLALISLNALRVRNCDFVEGFLFFFLLPLPTAFYAGALGVLVGTVAPSRRRWRAALLIVSVLAPPAWSAWLLFSQPPIFAYDHLWGYFAGSLYDEAIGITSTLWVFRAVTCARVAGIAAIVWSWRRPGALRPLVVAGVALTATFLEIELGPRAGFRVDRADIEQALPQRIERPGVVLHLPRDVTPDLAKAIVDDHEFRLQPLRERLAVKHTIDSYVYASADSKARWMGGRGTMFAKPWLAEIHIHGLQREHDVLPHELVHALAAPFGSRPFGVSARYGVLVNMALTEGLAEALTLPDGPQDHDTYVRALREAKQAPDVRRLLDPAGFWQQAPRRAYVVAGSFVRYLIATHGIERFKSVYAHGDFAAVYGKPIDALVTDWETTIDALPLLERDRIQTEERFRSPSIFEKPCAHVIAKLRDRAAAATPHDAIAIQRRICAHLGDTPQAQLDLAKALRRTGDIEGYRVAAEKLLGGPGLTRAQRAELQEGLGDVAWQRGDREAAARLFADVLTSSLSLDSERLQWVRLWALKLEEPLYSEMRLLLSGKRPTTAALERLSSRTADATVNYLVGRQWHVRKDWQRATEQLTRAANHPFVPIEAERLRLLADVAQTQADYARAARWAAAYRNLVPSSGERVRADDWLARLSFMAARDP